MARPGPKPLPTRLLAARGGRVSDRREPEAEPDFADGAPDPPSDLDDEGMAEWNRVAGELESTGVLYQVNRSALIAYCHAWSVYERHRIESLTAPVLIPTENGGLKANPIFTALNKTTKLMIDLAGELGLTPSSRTRVRGSPRPSEVSTGVDLFPFESKAG